MIKAQYISLLFRIGALSFKLLALFYLARILPSYDFISYGIITVTIAYLQYVIGLDIYNYANRKVAMSGSKVSLLKVISKQYSFYFSVYLVMIFITLFTYFFSLGSYVLIPENFFLLVTVLISEHLFNECYRLWVFKSKATFSALLYFLKSVVFVSFIFIYNLSAHHVGIREVLSFWLISNALSILLSNYRFNVFYIVARTFYIDFKWMKSAIVFSFPLVLSALCSKAVFTFDRTLAGLLLEIDSAATYILLMSIFFAVNSLLDSVFFVFKAPVLIKSYQKNLSETFGSFLKGGGVIITICSFMFLPGFYLSKLIFPDKVSDLDFYSFVCSGVVFWLFNMSQIYHYGLYAVGAPKRIFNTQLVSLILCALFFVTGYVLQVASYIEFFFLSLGVYCLSALLLKRKAFLFLKESEV